MNKALQIFLLTLALLSTSAYADEWNGPDKRLHFTGGFAVASIVTAATGDEMKGFLASSAVGILKEVADEHRYSGASGKDLVVTVIGAYVGAKVTGFTLTKSGLMYTKQMNIF